MSEIFAPEGEDGGEAAMSETRAFLEALFGAKDDGDYVLGWARDGRKSKFTKMLDDAEEWLTVASARTDVYVGVGLSRMNYGRGKRCPAGEVIAIPGLWLDLDVAHAVHKKSNLPPTIDDGFKLLLDLPFRPTLTVWSGHGLQAWWLFKELWRFENDEERKRAAGLASAWQDYIRGRAKWSIDATHDLARLMRVPGTVNRKADPPVPVSIVWEPAGSPRYSPDDFFDFAGLPKRAASNGNGTATTVTFKLSATAKADPAKFGELCQVDPQFYAAWSGKRKFPSPSERDQSLANRAARSGWSDQEITDLLVECRRNHENELRLDNPAKYRLTIEKAREHARKFHGERGNGACAPAADDANNAPIEERRAAVFATLAGEWKIKPVRFVKYRADEPSYRLEFDRERSVLFPSVSALTKPAAFRDLIFGATNVLLPRVRADRHDEWINALSSIVEEESIGRDATEIGKVEEWWRTYLDYYPPKANLEEAKIQQSPYFDEDGRLVIFAADLLRWLNQLRSRPGEFSPQWLGPRLRAAHAESKTINVVNKAGKKTTCSVWKLPPDADRFLPERATSRAEARDPREDRGTSREWSH